MPIPLRRDEEQGPLHRADAFCLLNYAARGIRIKPVRPRFVRTRTLDEQQAAGTSLRSRLVALEPTES